MTFKINDFHVVTAQRIVELEETYFKPSKLSSSGAKIEKYVKVNKTREITVFNHISFYEQADETYYSVIDDVFIFIDFVEILKAFSNKKLDTNREYKIADAFTAQTAQSSGEIYLKIDFKNFSNSLFLDKFECSSFAAKFSKILQRCEAWQELEA